MDTAVKKEPAAHMAPLAVEHLPVAAIERSPTNPRKTFDKAKLDELAGSIKVQGVLSPILVRKIGVKYELVAGERRWRATKLAGLEHIPALVRPLTDVEVLEIQLTENLQRDDLDPLEEAAGYKQLMALKKINADALAELLGKSRSYVYTRTKLNDLCPEAVKALQEGKLDASRGLLIARIGHHDTQRQALKAALAPIPSWRGGGTMSYRDLREHIQDEYMLRLSEAPFDPKDANLVAKAGACTVCPKRTGNQPDLFGDIKNADVCTDSKCFANKRSVHVANVRKSAESKGQVVISGNEAKKILGKYGDAQNGYTTLHATCYDDPKNRKVVQIVGNDHPAIELVQRPDGNLVKVVKTSVVTDALNKKGIKTHQQKVAAQRERDSSPETRAKQQRQEEIDELLTAQLTKAIHDRHPTQLSRDFLLGQANRFANEYGDADVDAVARLNGWKSGSELRKKLKTLTPGKLVCVLLDLELSERINYDGMDPLIEAAERYKIDHKAIEKKILADFGRLDAEKKAKDAAASKAKTASEKKIDKKIADAPKKAKAKAKGKKK